MSLFDTQCLTPEGNVRSETSVTVPSTLNVQYCSLMVEQFDPASLHWFEIADLMVGVHCQAALKAPCPGHVLSTLLAIRTFEMGILAMMKKVCYLSEHLFLVELSLCRKCHGIYHSQEQTGSREACQPSLLFSLLSSGWKTVAQRKALNSLKCSQNRRKTRTRQR